MKTNNINNLLIALFFTIPFISFGQFPGCPHVDAGPDSTLDCSTSCIDLTATPFETGGTDSYAVSSIAYNPPVSFNQPGGTAVSVNTDDVWSANINLPFDFCFYGETYSTAKIGSNGAVGLGSFSATHHPWKFSNSVPSPILPTNGGVAGNVFGPYHDVDPSVGGTIKYYLLGAAPCRILAVVFNELPHFSCNSKTSSFMMVFYETTNAIDVYVKQKETCSSWNGGNAVIGIQNNAGTQGITAPGRNTGSWTIPAGSPEAWRFSPDGSPIYTVEWLEEGNVIGTGKTINVCPSGETDYVSRVTYTPCNAGNTVVVTDTLTVFPDPNAPELEQEAVDSSNCTAADGSLEVSANGGAPPYQFSIDNGSNYQSSGVFDNLTSGSYDITVKDDNDCESTLTIEVPEKNPLTISINTSDISCFGNEDGEIKITPYNGTNPYSYSIDGGSSQPSNIFSDLTEGTYQIEVEDNGGCTKDTSITINEPDEIVLSGNVMDVSCFEGQDGEINTSVTGGSPNYTYTINGANPQNSPDFDSLVEGDYEIIVEDAEGCTDTLDLTISEPAAPTTEISSTDPSYCAEGTTQIQISGVTNGTFSQNPSSGLNTSSTGEVELNDADPGDYDIIYSYTENGCDYKDTVSIEVLELPDLELEDTIQLCDGQTWIPDAQGADSYIWSDGLQNGDTVQGVIGEETFNVTGTSANGCTSEDSIVVITNPSPVVDLIADPLQGMPPLEVTFENLSSGADTYIWDFDDGYEDEISDSIVIYDYEIDGVYQVILTGSTDLGCSDTAMVTIEVVFPEMEYEFPNVFTPNGDGDNDNFKLINAENIASLEIVILNRWGNVVFEDTGADFKWNGQTKNSGANCSEGVYFYKAKLIDLSGEEVSEHGYIHLVRSD